MNTNEKKWLLENFTDNRKKEVKDIKQREKKYIK